MAEKEQAAQKFVVARMLQEMRQEAEKIAALKSNKGRINNQQQSVLTSGSYRIQGLIQEISDHLEGIEATERRRTGELSTESEKSLAQEVKETNGWITEC